MKKMGREQSGEGILGFLFWIAVVAVLGWLGWQLYQHPESFNPKAASHHAYEDTQPQTQQ